MPLTYRPGDLAEVDFFEVLVDVDGTRRKAWLFLMRLMYSGRDFAWIYERQDQISFLDGHVRGHTRDEILREYPYLEAEDIAEALSYAAWRAEEVEVPLRQP